MERKTMVEMIEKAIREASELDPGMDHRGQLLHG